MTKIFLLAFCCLIFAGATIAGPMPEGVSLLPPNADPSFALSKSNDTAATLTVQPVTGQAFTQSLQVDTVQPGPNPWSTQLTSPTIAPVQQGDTLLLTLWVKAVRPNDGSAQVGFVFERASDPYTKSLEFSVRPTGLWQKISLPFKSLDSYAPGAAHVTLPLASTVQSVEIADIQLIDYGPSLPLASFQQTHASYGGREPDAPWRAAAAARIRKYREASLTVTVTDAKGKPVRGAAVHIAMTQHAFAFGTAVNAAHLFGTAPDDLRYQHEVPRLFNEIVAENETKWPAWSNNPQPGIDIVNWGLAHGMTVRGHNLVWGSWRNSPGWLHVGYDQVVQNGGPDEGRAYLEQQITTHIKDEATAFKGKCIEFDVVNEPVDNNDFTNILGPGAIAEWYKTAHSADPGANLFLNDYDTLYGQAPDSNVNGRVANIASLLAAGAPLSAIGIESHIGSGAIPSTGDIIRSLDTYSRFNLPIKMTEYDFTTNDTDLQADFTRDYMTLAFSYPNVQGFLVWGFWDGSHWLNNSAIYNRDWTLKKSGQIYEELVFKKWWTDDWGKSDQKGSCTTRGFLGNYTITVTKGHETKTVDTSLVTGGDRVNVVL